MAVFMNLRRITTSGNFIPQIDGIRFIAITSVVLLHLQGMANGVAGNWFYLGWRGVHLFFVLSGFILGMPFAKAAMLGGRQPSLSAYYLRRVSRLEPPFLLSAIIVFIVLHAVSLHHNHGDIGIEHFLATLTYSHVAVFGAVSTINPVTWSLEVEIQFYLLLPLIALVYRLRTRRTILVIAIAVFSLARFVSPYPRVVMSLLGNAQFFSAGLLLADLYITSLPSRSYRWDVISLFWPLVFAVDGKWFMALMPVLCIALYMAAFCGKVSSKLLSWAPITVIGGMCYTIYLFHFQVESLCTRYFTGFWLFAIAVPATLVFSLAFYVFIERPCMNTDWPKRLLSLSKCYGRENHHIILRHRSGGHSAGSSRV